MNFNTTRNIFVNLIKGFPYLAIVLLLLISCKEEVPQKIEADSNYTPTAINELPLRSGDRPETTDQVPHMQIGVSPVPEVHQEMVKRIYAIPGVDDQPSVIGSWRGIWISNDIPIRVPEALISGREFAHIHDDGSLHIFLEPGRAREAVTKGWAVYHPFALTDDEDWIGFVMLYTPQSFEELDVTFQLVADGYDYVTGK